RPPGPPHQRTPGGSGGPSFPRNTSCHKNASRRALPPSPPGVPALSPSLSDSFPDPLARIRETRNENQKSKPKTLPWLSLEAPTASSTNSPTTNSRGNSSPPSKSKRNSTPSA